MSRNPDIQQRFVSKLQPGLHLSELFEYLPELYLYVKDRSSRFVKANRPLISMMGLDEERSILGKTDFDFFPRHLAEQYVAEDARVMRSRTAMPNQVWLVPRSDGSLKWLLSTKVPLFDRRGRVVGLAGVMRDLEKAESVVRAYQEFEQVITFVLQHFGQRIKIEELAHMAHLSISQFDRRFKQLFQMTPQDYVLRVRINAACQLLVSGPASASEVAQRTGFYDQSYFTKQFRRHMGLTPLAYRRKYSLAAHRL